MRLTLVDVQKQRGTFNKDLAGGFGTSSSYGNSWLLKALTTVKRKMVVLPIMSFGYLNALMRQKGVDIRISTGGFVAGTDVYLIYTSTVSHKAELEFAREARATGAKVGFFGPLSEASEGCFTDDCNFIIKGEAENIPDIFNRDLNGVIDAGRVEDLDSLPFPRWTEFDYKSFSYQIYLRRRPIFPVLSSRGCPYPCGYYCPYPHTQGKKFRPRSPENVIEELRYLTVQYGARGVIFRDPIFTFQKERAAQIAEGILKAGLKLDWACETKPSHLEPGLLRLMHRAGLRGINLGVESVTPEVLETSKRHSSGDVQIFLDECRKLGIKVGAFYSIGHLSDTEASIKDTIKFAQTLCTDYAQFTVVTPYPGTEFYRDVQAKVHTTDWEQYNSYTPVFEHPELSSDTIIALKEKAMRSYYTNPAWVLRYLRQSTHIV